MDLFMKSLHIDERLRIMQCRKMRENGSILIRKKERTMLDLLIRAGCFVAIIILGLVLRQIGFFKENAFEVLSKIVLKITLPAAIIKNFASSNVEISMLTLALLGFGGGLAYSLAALAVNIRGTKEQRAFDILNLPGYNIGVFALPFISSFLGPMGVVTASVFDVGNSVVCLGGIYGVATSIKAGSGFSVKRICRALLTSVPFLCYIIMLPISLFQVPVPQPILACADIIASGNAFLAMLMIGVGFKLKMNKEQLGHVIKVVVLRYAIATALALIFYYLLPFSLEIRQTLVLLSFSPISASVPGFTRELGEDAGLSSTINSVCIVISIIVMVSLLSVMLA